MWTHQSMTQSDLEKKRCPPMSMRLPLWLYDCARPPIAWVASRTITSLTPRRASSDAAVTAAGPAPTTRTLAIALTSREKEQLSQPEIEREHDAGGNELRLLVREAELIHRYIYDELVQEQAANADRREEQEFGPAIREAPAREDPS